MVQIRNVNLFNYRQVFYLSVILLVCFELSAQNMVINSSFENYSECPDGPSKMYYALNVSSPPQNEAEYFNACSTHPWYSVPYQEGYNYQEAHYGEAYVGVFMYQPSSYREYVQMELSSTLENGKHYNVEFWTNRVNGHYGGRYAVNNIGLLFRNYFSDTTDCPTEFCSLLNIVPSILKFDNSIITDTLYWVKIAGIYKSDGTENFVVIGNFFTNSDTDTLDMKDEINPYKAGYYFIDDVLVEEITQPFWQYLDTTVYCGDSVLIGPALTGLDIDWYTDNLDFISNAPGIYVTPPTS